MRNLALAAVCSALVLACLPPQAAPTDEGRPDAESESESSSSESEAGSSEAESESGPTPDLPNPERPEFASPAEAIDLDPDPDVVRVQLVAAPYEYEIDGESISGYAYNEQVPGPTIRAKRGDTVIIDFVNELGMGSTIHWHGLHVPWEMDGVTWMGSPIASGESFEYSFTLDQSGTYWYHPHFNTGQQVDLGLYGGFIVEEPDEPELDDEIVVFVDGWGEHNAPPGHHEGAIVNWTVNGLADPVYRPAAGTRTRMRVIDVANAGYVDLEWPEIRRIASDQGLLPELDQPESVVLGPGDRVDGELLIGSNAFDLLNHPYSLFGPGLGEPIRLMSVEPEGEEPAPGPATWPFEEQAPSPDPGYADVLYTLMGEPDEGAWSINGEYFPDVTVYSVPLGEEAIIEVRNISGSQHPFHLHGYAFEVLSRNGVAPPVAEFEDTTNIEIGERMRVRIFANNPGDWMTHCHILPHAEMGMMTVLRVE